MALHIGDTLTTPVTFATDVELAGYSLDAGQLIGPDGEPVTVTIAATVNAADGIVTVSLPAAWTFPTDGVYWLSIRLKKSSSRLSLPAEPLVVIDPAPAWHNIETARLIWPDAEHLEDLQAWELLEIARHDVLQFAPALAEGDSIPPSYRRAQILHAQNILNAAAVDPSTGEDGSGSFALRPFPLDWHIKQLLRPRSPRAVVA